MADYKDKLRNMQIGAGFPLQGQPIDMPQNDTGYDQAEFDRKRQEALEQMLEEERQRNLMAQQAMPQMPPELPPDLGPGFSNVRNLVKPRR